MEKLQNMLRNYNQMHAQDFDIIPWAKQYRGIAFPKYWEIVYSIIADMNKNSRIIEIGCGQGDITAIPYYLQFANIISFEKDHTLAYQAENKIKELFRIQPKIACCCFPNGLWYNSDILILVNCAYKDMANTKQEYMTLMIDYYKHAGSPQYFIMEVIDSSYNVPDEEFPEYIRLSEDDIHKMFPNSSIKSWETYIYPINKRSKTLYLIDSE